MKTETVLTILGAVRVLFGVMLVAWLAKAACQLWEIWRSKKP